MFHDVKTPVVSRSYYKAPHVHGPFTQSLIELRLTLWRPLLPYGYSYSILCHTGLSSHF